MEEKRKRIISQIENKKNQAIKDLTLQHEKKYTNIKNYYQEITNTNMEIIKSLKNDLQQKKADDNMKQKQLLDQEAKSLMVIEPMKAANEEIQTLEKVKEEYQKISAKLEKYKEQI